jgi:hypothetical protein
MNQRKGRTVTSRTIKVLTILGLLIAASLAAVAQTTTGRLRGTV